MNNLDTIIATLKSVNNIAVDDHRTTAVLKDQLRGIKAVGTIGENVVSFIPGEMRPCSINALYLGDDGMVHISKIAVGFSRQANFATFIYNITVL